MRQVDLGLTKLQAKRALPLLRGGLDLLATKGWCQGSDWMSADGDYDPKHKDKFCAYGAIAEVAGRKSINSAITALDAMVLENTGKDYGIMDYNDANRRTKRQVMNLFKQTIDQVRLRIKGGN